MLGRCKFICSYWDKTKKNICDIPTSSIFCDEHTTESVYNNVVIKVINNISSKCIYFYDKPHKRYMKDIYCRDKWLACQGDTTYINAFNYAYHQYKQIIPQWTAMYLVFKYHIAEAFDIYYNMVYYYLHFQ